MLGLAVFVVGRPAAEPAPTSSVIVLPQPHILVNKITATIPSFCAQRSWLQQGHTQTVRSC